MEPYKVTGGVSEVRSRGILAG